jgi:hypothetical protein
MTSQPGLSAVVAIALLIAWRFGAFARKRAHG